MIGIGSFFFKYRNVVFIFLYLTLFLPSPAIADPVSEGWITVAVGLLISLCGQLVRGATIGMSYIIRGGRDGRVYAEGLVTEGIFSHARNPLYIGNILMLLGMGILANSLLFVLVVMPFFCFIYQSIVLAEEAFLRNKFGENYDLYCKDTNRWMLRLQGIGKTFRSMRFNWKRWIVKEYNTLFIWLTAMVLLFFFRYPAFVPSGEHEKHMLLMVMVGCLSIGYVFVRWNKKRGPWRDVN
ncbi:MULTISPECIES: methyltransferase family protein [Olivibacter]|uniref:Methyltransferase family protein n=1 Tax=Olivibacter oleidegradans TaxID=760123 RepID=A0ABV6HIM4_9SPHI|nr:isoprenylcysteine carboxylmethyltransferase family protein [Olivibacter jilunii]